MKDIILAPVVTEKTAGITADGNKVVFKVAKDANKAEIAKAVAEPFNQIDKITIVGGSGDGGVGSVGSYVPQALAQTMAAMKEATGIDLKDLIEANGKDAKITRNVNITGIEGASASQAVGPVVAGAIAEDGGAAEVAAALKARGLTFESENDKKNREK